MRKDDALRLAKIDYLKTANKERSLPYYWSNMIIMGNTDPIALVDRNYLPWLFAVAGLLAVIIAFLYAKKKKKNSR